MKKLIYLLMIILSLPGVLYAQANDNIMYRNGRIYVVIAVLLTIFIGIILYIIRIDRKISKMKKDGN